MDAAAAEADVALARFGLALKADIAVSEDPHSFAIGEEQFNRRLHFEYALSGSAPELWRYGLHLVEEVESSLERTAREINPNATWRAQAERLRAEAPVPANLIEYYRGAMERAREFVLQHDLVNVPAAPLEVVPTPEFIRPLVPFAAYSPPVPIPRFGRGGSMSRPRTDRASRPIDRSMSWTAWHSTRGTRGTTCTCSPSSRSLPWCAGCSGVHSRWRDGRCTVRT